MEFRIDVFGAIEDAAEILSSFVQRKVAEIKAAAGRMRAQYEAQRKIELKNAEALRQLRYRVNDLRDEICLATQNSHVGTEQCREALASASKNLTKAIDLLEGRDITDKIMS